MHILGVHSGGHDAAAALFNEYDLAAAVQQERLTRRKGDGGYPEAALTEALSVAGLTTRDADVIALSRNNIERRYLKFPGVHKIGDWYSRKVRGKSAVSLSRVLRLTGVRDARALFRKERFLRDKGFRRDAEVFFFNHHLAHALSALFYTDWEDALVYTADAAGDNVQYSARVLRNGELTCLFGGEDRLMKPPVYDSVARAYAYATEACGFRSFRHEGKLTGLAAFGEPLLAEAMQALFFVTPEGEIGGRFRDNDELRRKIFALSSGQDRAVIAASVQVMLETLTLESVRALLRRHPVRRLALAGGVFANVRLNALLKEKLGLEEIFICPAMGDEGMALGGPLCYLLERDGTADWLAARRRLNHMCFGRDYTGAADSVFAASGKLTAERPPEGPARLVAEALAAGEAGAVYTGRMEYGPRALGARSIVAGPARRDVNDSLNKRLTRTEFMPFAPYVAEEDAAEVFAVDAADAYACRFMTITVPVREHWRDRIPAVVHVDGTARPQIIRREENPLYYDILKAFKEKTGLPVLVNTSFNAHEEPIINTPQECLRALLDDRVDFVVTDQAIWRRKPAAGA